MNRNKWKSRRWLLVIFIIIWSMIVITTIVFKSNGNYENLAIAIFGGSVGSLITYLINDTKEKMKYIDKE